MHWEARREDICRSHRKFRRSSRRYAPRNHTGSDAPRLRRGNGTRASSRAIPASPRARGIGATLVAEALIDGSEELLVKKCVEMALGGGAAANRVRRPEDDDRSTRSSHPPLSYPRNRKRQLSLQEQLGESRQTRKGETSKLDERLTPKPSSSRVSSQWKSRVSSPRKSTQAKLHPFTADERGKKREFRARQRESDPAPESRVSEIFRTPSRLPDPPPARVCSPRPPSGSTSGVKRAGHSAASPAPLRLAFEKYSSGRKRVCPG
jgi:hypothetical protein